MSISQTQQSLPVENIAFASRELAREFDAKLRCHLGRIPENATKHDLYTALALVVRDRLFARAMARHAQFAQEPPRTVAYLSAEFLPGPHLANNLLNLGLEEAAVEAMRTIGYELEEILQQEHEPGLGNGGLGRLASCYLDSLASVEVSAIGYGIRYEFGIFEQVLRDGWQDERTDKWLKFGNPWEQPRPEITHNVSFGGRVTHFIDDHGRFHAYWNPDLVVKGVGYDTPILGYQVETCNFLRLWKAEAIESFDFGQFNRGNYDEAVEAKVESETITKVLYPNDETQKGKALRLKQQYFFSSCSLQDMLRIHALVGGEPATFHEKWAVQLNDTHPAIAVVELMRLLLDVHGMGWEEAWKITTATFSYTNHTLLPEALERWTIDLFGALLPRHLQIILEINRRFLDEVRARFPEDDAIVARMSIIDETGPRYVRMAHLACIGSHTINGVAELHSELLKQTVLRHFATLWPEKFCNVTNGITPRRFVGVSNPGLARLIGARIGNGWLKAPERLRQLEPIASNSEFQAEWMEVKLANKRRLANAIAERLGIEVSPNALFDVQVKRIHEYKRQHLAALHILSLYLRLKENPEADIPARVFIFGGKAAPGYFMAKRIIKLITSIGEKVNGDASIRGKLKVVFLPNFNVKTARDIYPAADLSEQISMAGMEASGTGNMKFSFNGALTIGTLDGANVEIRREVGGENFFLFGLTAPEVEGIKARGYRPRAHYEENELLRRVIDFVRSGELAQGDASIFRPIVENLLDRDPYLVLADFQAYLEAQERVSALWQSPADWGRMSILNTARMGYFSSDRSIRQYCERIWHIPVG